MGASVSRRGLFWLAGATGLAGIAGGVLWVRSGASDSVGRDQVGDQVQRLPRGRVPVFAHTPELERLYHFAVERRDVLQYMPCFCGCGQFGHRDNRECYVKAEHPDGTITFTSHAAT